MNVHANAKLGLAGRRALVLAIERGVTLRQAAASFSVSRLRLLTGGGTVGSRAAGSTRHWLIVPPGLTISRAGSPRPRRSRSCVRAGRPTWGRAVWPGSSAGHARRSGRSSFGTGSRADSELFQTLQNEWAYSGTWPDSGTRARSLLSFLRYYNRQRPHSSLGDRPPISRIHNVCGQDS